MNNDQATELIETFYQTIMAREKDEVSGLNEGLHNDKIKTAGFAIFQALTNTVVK